jgi:hypothetical protein
MVLITLIVGILRRYVQWRPETSGRCLRVSVLGPLIPFLLLTVFYRGVELLTPGGIAEMVVFAATRRENVVTADTLIFPSHQAGGTALYRKI